MAAGDESSHEFEGRLLRDLRKSRQWTQGDLARQVHAERSAISKWENGKSVPENSTVSRLCELFEKPVGFFYDPAEHQRIKASVVIGHQASFIASAPSGR